MRVKEHLGATNALQLNVSSCNRPSAPHDMLQDTIACMMLRFIPAPSTMDPEILHNRNGSRYTLLLWTMHGDGLIIAFKST